MDTTGMSREERAALRAYVAMSEVTETAGAVVLAAPELPTSPMLNRVVGLGAGRPATEADVDAALAAIAPGTSYYVAVAPGARPAQLPQWLAARGLEPGWGWMLFTRGVDDAPARPTTLRLAEATDGPAAADFARVVCQSYGMPAAIAPRLAATTDAGWRCWVAYDGDEPAGAAALYVDGDVGYLGIAGTLPAHRGKGAQGALLARRIRAARELGCDLVVTETGERDAERPSNSYRNILRAGFAEVRVTANWLGTRERAA